MASGAPVGFGGQVLPNPNNIRPMADTDQPQGTPTQLQGATLSDGVYRGGQPQMNASNPAPAQIIPGMMRTAGTKGDGPDPLAVIADKEFQGFSPADKRTIFSKVIGDKSFNDLNDAETMEFFSRATARIERTRPDLIPPPGVPRPQVNMQPASFAPQPGTQYQTNEPAPTSGMAGWEYRHPVGSALAESGGIAALGTGEALAGGGAGIARPLISDFAKSLPATAKAMGKGALVEEIARRGAKALGVKVPDWVPAMAGMMAAGAEKRPGAASSESAAAASTEAEASGTRVPVGKLAKEVPNPDPYKFKGAPTTMDVQQSTNVGKTGYDPDTRTMTVEYKSGQVYSYHGVPPEIYKQAQDADSVGSYISRNVKGRYETVRRGSVLVKKR